MPNWSNFYSVHDDETSASAWQEFASGQMQQYEGWVQERVRQNAIIEQMIQEDALREEEQMEDRRKYPLFFWRENTK